MYAFVRLALLVLLAFPFTTQQPPSSQTSAPFVPVEVLNARTIAVAVYWPDAGWRDKAEVQADGENFLRRWKRYKVVRISEAPDLIALVTVEPAARSGGFWRSLASALAVGAQAYARSAQNYEQCHGQTYGNQVDVTCYGYSPGPASAPPPPAPNYVLSGTILVFDGRFLRTGGPIPEPLLFADADNRGSTPLIGAAKRLRQMVEQAEKAQPERMATVNALTAKIHELAVANRLSGSEESGCDLKISQQIGANGEMLTRLERRDFGDVERLFPELCQPAENQK